MAGTSISSFQLGTHSSPEAVMNLLTSHGVVVIPGYLSGEQLNGVRSECAKLADDQSAGIVERKYHPGRSQLVHRAAWNASNYPAIENTIDAPFMRDIASRYFRRGAAFNYQFFLTRETKSGAPITGLHYDRLVTLKFFIYLLDTTTENGAFECVPGTHESVAATRAHYVKRGVRLLDLPNFELPSEIGAPIPIEGAAGTMLIFTTDVIHQGGIVTEGRNRWVLRAHTRPLPLPEYQPRPWASRQWWRESAFNPRRYYYRVMDRVAGNVPPIIHAQ